MLHPDHKFESSRKIYISSLTCECSFHCTVFFFWGGGGGGRGPIFFFFYHRPCAIVLPYMSQNISTMFVLLNFTALQLLLKFF